MGPKKNPGRKVKSTDTSFDILEALHTRGEMSVTELADHLQLAKSTVHTHLATLESKEFVVKQGQHYRISLKALDYGIKAKEAYSMLLETSAEPMKQLADETGDTVWLFVLEHGKAIYLSVEFGERAVPTRGQIGMRASVFRLAAGKAMLAHLPEPQQDTLISEVDFETNEAIPFNTEQDLRRELEEIREQGVAFNRGKTVSKSRALSAPIMSGDEIVGAISLAGLKTRFTGEYYTQELPQLLKNSANEIELRLEYPSKNW